MGSAGEALLFLLPSEAGYVAMLAARGVALQAQPLMPLLDCLDRPDEREVTSWIEPRSLHSCCSPCSSWRGACGVSPGPPVQHRVVRGIPQV